MEAAVTNDRYTLVDNGGALKSPRLIGAQLGITVRQEINHIFLETGLLKKYYFNAVAFRGADVYGINNAFNAWLIPLRFGTKINLYKEKLLLVPMVGYSFCIDSDYGHDSAGRGETRSNSSTATFTYQGNNSVAKHFPLLQTGIGLECKLFSSMLLTLSSNYYTGLKKVYEMDIQYTIDGGAPVEATAISKGDFFNVSVGVKYSISSLWGKN